MTDREQWRCSCCEHWHMPHADPKFLRGRGPYCAPCHEALEALISGVDGALVCVPATTTLDRLLAEAQAPRVRG